MAKKANGKTPICISGGCMNTTNQDYTKKVEKSITDWESTKTTNIMLDTMARHLAVIADRVTEDKDTKTE